MQVFLVMKSSGSYEDYCREVDKAFSNHKDAELYITIQKRYWDDVKKRLERCKECQFCREIDNAENQEAFMKESLDYCSDAVFDWDELQMPCRLCLWYDGIPTWDIDVREVE